MEIRQGGVARKIIVGGVNTKVGISDGRARHIDAVNNLLEEGRGVVVRLNVVNGEEWDGGKKSEMHCIFKPKESTSHMINNQIT